MVAMKGVQVDSQYGTGGQAKLPADFYNKWDQAFAYCQWSAGNGETVLPCVPFYPGEYPYLIRMKPDGTWDETLGDQGYKVLNLSTKDEGIVRLRRFVQVPEQQGGGFVGVSLYEIPVARQGVPGTARMIAVIRLDASLDLVPSFGEQGISKPAFEPSWFDGWEQQAPAQRSSAVSRADAHPVNRQVMPRLDSLVPQLTFKDNRLQVVFAGILSTADPDSGVISSRVTDWLALQVDLQDGRDWRGGRLARAQASPPLALINAVFLGDGRVVVAGILAENVGALACYLPDGTLDQRFGADGSGVIRYTGYPEVFTGNGSRLIVAEHLPTALQVHGLLADGATDPSFNSGAPLRLNATGSISFEYGYSCIDEEGAFVLITRDNSDVVSARVTASGGLDTLYGNEGGYFHDRHPAYAFAAVTAAISQGFVLKVPGALIRWCYTKVAQHRHRGHVRLWQAVLRWLGW
ncbi:hypothetical protein ACIPM0_16455 [Pseudomonas sichuanensis]|uniref:hypothetical protein n=1 Tax=Pseudomonas TaxID=286 RepID=UPI0037FB7488